MDKLEELRASIEHTWPYIDETGMGSGVCAPERFARNLGAVVIIALHKNRIIGAACGEPLMHEAASLGDPLIRNGEAIEDFFYFAQLLLDDAYRGMDLEEKLFEAIEHHAREIGFARVNFCADYAMDSTLERTGPKKTKEDRAIETLWRTRNYRPLMGARFSPQADPDQDMQIWVKDLNIDQQREQKGRRKAVAG
ncbi:hypothetical protein [uncultured Cohaesibacter sp.]|uniref:hypothetical protein n=1 Tax=uncultured Cohaesibacter sp. TaxID=1002546 RepID=UPI0029C791ED|nr:hypothetical protein [uncultured Cohaesibacter sp.]